MKSTAVIFRSELLEHELGTSHPFRSRERLTLYLKLLEEFGMLGDFAGVKVVEPELTATDEDILAVHDLSLLEKIKRLSESGGVLDADTPVPARTYERARIQIGGSIYGAKLVLDGSFARAVQCLTLGGHHATSRHTGRSFGFCYFNQQAVVIRHLQREGYVNRVLVLDCDAHHGNGIQEIFYEDPDLLYISLHQDPRTLYPGTGFFWEQGEGRGKGYTVNCPLPPRTLGSGYLKVLREICLPLASAYKPDLVYLIIGADNHFADPLTHLNLRLSDFGEIVSDVVRMANEVCQGRVIMELGGGYNLEASAYAFLISTAALAEASIPEVEEYQQPRQDARLEAEVDFLIAGFKKGLAENWSYFKRST